MNGCFCLSLDVFADETEGSMRAIKELSPEPTIQRLVMPHNHISNRNIIQ